MAYAIGENQSCEAKGKIRQSQPLVGQDGVWKRVKLSGAQSFDHLWIGINTAFRYSYVISVFRHFLTKKGN